MELERVNSKLGILHVASTFYLAPVSRGRRQPSEFLTARSAGTGRVHERKPSAMSGSVDESPLENTPASAARGISDATSHGGGRRVPTTNSKGLPKRQRTQPGSAGVLNSGTLCVQRKVTMEFCNQVLTETEASSGGPAGQGTARVDDACVSAVQQACGELCKVIVHVARRCLLAEPEAENRKRLTVKQLVAAVHELRQLGVLVDSPTLGAVELRSDFGDSRGCDPRIGPHSSQSTPGSSQSELVGTSKSTAPPDEVARSQQQVPVSKFLLQAESTSSTLQAMQWLTQDAHSSGPNPLALDAAGGRSGAGAGAVGGTAGSGGGNAAVVLNEYL